MSAAAPSADRNLLFGILALQMDFVSRDALIRAMHAWVLQKAKPLGQVLREQGALPDDAHALVEALVQKHLERHGNDPQRSLAALSSIGPVREDLRQVADADVQASLAHACATCRADTDPHATRPPSAGATSAGLRFHILRPHARGGLGEVYVALDGELHREVALKEIQERHADNPESRARFLLEAEVTGGLEHPGIVPVYGLGTYGDGRPFYAMRFIRGDSLKDAVERFHRERESLPAGERVLRLRQMLGRFVDVCQAVAYAHSRGVLHRDLKPGNVMLGPYGETLVVDWGLAKVTGRPEREGTAAERTLRPPSVGGLAQTAVGAAVGTPAYMSPEQAAGRLDRLGPASDVYSLGAMLYALLTGRAPFEGASAAEVLERVRKGQLVPPRQVCREVPQALEAVCLKAMALRPEDRYPSAGALAEDVERFLADEPVTALREPLTARARRWARKHPGPVAGVAAAVLVGLMGLGISAAALGRKNYELELARKAEADRAEGEAEAKRAALASAAAEKRAHEQAQRRLAQVVKGNAVLAGVFRDINPKSQEREGKALRVLLGERLTEAVKQLEGEAVGDPLIVARLQYELARSLQELGHLQEAEAVLLKTRRPFEQLLGPDDPATLRSVNALAGVYHELARYGEAEALHKQVLEARRQKLGPDHPDTLGSMNNLAEVYRALARYEQAETLLRQVLEAQRRTLGADDPDTLTTVNNLAMVDINRGRYDGAEKLFKQALEPYRRRLGPQHPDTLRGMSNLAGLYQARGRFDEAEPLLKQALEIKQNTLGPDHPATLQSMSNLVGLCRARGRYDEAESLCKRALEGYRHKLGPDHPDTLGNLNNLATLYQERGRYDEAEPLYRQVLEANRQQFGPDHPHTLKCRNNLAMLYAARGRYGEAEPLVKQVLEAQRRTLGADHSDTLTTMNNLAGLYWSRKRLDRSIPLFEETFALARKKLGPDHPSTLLTLRNLGVNYRDAGRLGDGIRCLEQALAAARQRPGGPLPDQIARALIELAATYERANQPGKAEALEREFLEKARPWIDAGDLNTLTELANLAARYWSRRQLDRSIPLFEEVLARQTSRLGADHPYTLIALANLGVNYRDAGRLGDGIRCLEQALAAARKRPGPLRAELTWVPGDLAETYMQANQPGKAEALDRQSVEEARRQFGPGDLRTARALALLGWHLLRQDKHAEAEKPLRDCLAIRRQKEPAAWSTFNTQAQLGAALLGQKKYAEAEPLLLKGYEGMKQREAMIPPQGKVRLTEALQWLVQLYDAWDKPDEAARWRKELDASKAEARKAGAKRP
jgi:tetratricopeptide (TPR) repeat protein/tRNA A-37 threonylcarbamoyl transferase component Bud32